MERGSKVLFFDSTELATGFGKHSLARLLADGFGQYNSQCRALQVFLPEPETTSQQHPGALVHTDVFQCMCSNSIHSGR